MRQTEHQRSLRYSHRSNQQPFKFGQPVPQPQQCLLRVSNALHLDSPIFDATKPRFPRRSKAA